jgi:ribosomal protein S18 acetylase RimI-like enzyme
VIRRATTRDATAIADVHTRTWQHAYRGLVADDFLDSLSVVERATRWSEILSAGESRSTTLVDIDGEVLRGFVSVGPNRDDDEATHEAWEIFAIYVDPHFHRRGYGTDLLRAALAVVPLSASRTTLWVLEDNQTARTFYEVFGFQADGMTKSEQIGAVWLTEVRYAFLR